MEFSGSFRKRKTLGKRSFPFTGVLENRLTRTDPLANGRQVRYNKIL